MNQPLADAISALGMPANTVTEPLVDGASASAWRVRAKGVSFVLRLSPSPQYTDSRLAAIVAARCAGLPAPELVKRASTGSGEAVLLTWLAGTTLLDVVLRRPHQAAFWGRRMGVLQRHLHKVVGPMSMVDVLEDSKGPFAAGRETPGLPHGDSLLHLDWHPLNLLVDETTNELSGIIDWDNCRRGHPLLDLARTHSIFAFDPSVLAMPPDGRQLTDALARAWVEGYGPEAASIPAECHLWAARVMLADLTPRYSEEVLTPVQRSIEDWENRSA